MLVFFGYLHFGFSLVHRRSDVHVVFEGALDRLGVAFNFNDRPQLIGIITHGFVISLRNFNMLRHASLDMYPRPSPQEGIGVTAKLTI